MHRAVLSPDDEWRFGPGLGADPIRQVVRAHHAEEAEERTFTLAQNDGTTANDCEVCGFGRIADALFLFRRCDRKYAGEEPSGAESLRGDGAIVRDISAHLKATRDLLRMITFYAAAQWKIRRTAENEVELLPGRKHIGVAKISVPNIEPIPKAIPLNGFAGESNTFGLRFHRDKSCRGQSPRGYQRDRPNSATEVQHSTSAWRPSGPVPRREDIIC
jgi:hypothetical protein